jgi:hypothetical protein
MPGRGWPNIQNPFYQLVAAYPNSIFTPCATSAKFKRLIGEQNIISFSFWGQISLRQISGSTPEHFIFHFEFFNPFQSRNASRGRG